MVEAEGYIFRIATKEWVDQVFNLAIYYTGSRRKWKKGQTILFVHRTSVGDAFIGYGKIADIYSLEELSEEERRECEKRGWKKAIEFQYIVRFEKPLPVKETFLKDSKLRGKSLHSSPINKQQRDSIVNQAEKLSA